MMTEPDSTELHHPQDLHGKPLMLLIWLIDEEDKGMKYIVGNAVWDGTELAVLLGGDRPPFPISFEAVKRLPEPLLEISEGAIYGVTMGVASDPDVANNPTAISLGLTWTD